MSSLSAVRSAGYHQETATATAALLGATALGLAVLSNAGDSHITWNHCQVPCGIFDDPVIVSELRQACTTVRKAIRQSQSLHSSATGSDVLALNQLVRWINTKEEHCSKIISLTSEYCLCQRVKRVNFASEADYLQALKVHHRVMQAAMKVKQSMDEQDCIALEHAVEDLSKMYLK